MAFFLSLPHMRLSQPPTLSVTDICLKLGVRNADAVFSIALTFYAGQRFRLNLFVRNTGTFHFFVLGSFASLCGSPP